MKDMEAIEILPARAVENALDNNCQSISWTYNEPTMYLEYTLKRLHYHIKMDLKIYMLAMVI